MRSRGLVVAIAVVLAVLAAVGVIVYTSSVRDKAVDEHTTTVLASTQDIQAAHRLITEWSPYAPAQRTAAV